MILTTTSRDPGTETRKVARRVSELISYSMYTPRGARNIEKLVELARKKGYRRICIFNEKNKKPAEMQFIVLDAVKWDWHPKTLKIKDVAINKEHDKEILSELKVEGTLKNDAIELFDISSFDDSEDVLKADKKTIGFYSNDEEILKITVI